MHSVTVVDLNKFQVLSSMTQFERSDCTFPEAFNLLGEQFGTVIITVTGAGTSCIVLSLSIEWLSPQSNQSNGFIVSVGR